MISGQQNKPIF